ncbi:flagellin domain-containing protein [Enterobacter roggenkampii]|uniref:flagellin domain-containing protein n=1 Tax=Enterobacter roggenkampii TaxID=1812935 RepID=UPI00203236B2|nr:flagellin domain-containing protein [Enterobacter roggenkampii]
MSVINTNLLSLSTQNNLNKSQSALGTAIERLSSGLRINSAKDDAAGQAIANRMNSQIKGMTQAARNANDGISMIQTAEGNLNEINTNLQRIRELSVQAANGTNQNTDMTSINTEINQRLAEIDRIAGAANFNGKNLLDGSQSGGVTIQVGANTKAGDTISIGSDSLINAKLSSLASGTALSGGTASISDNTTAKAVIDAVDTALKGIDGARSNLGAMQNRFASTVNNLNNSVTNLSAAQSRIQDADYATEVSNMSRAQILQQAGTSVLSQANQVPQSMLSLLR